MPKIKLPKAGLLMQFKSDANRNPFIAEWLIESARNLGGPCETPDIAYRTLCDNASASELDNEDFDGEKGVLDECNGIRKMVEDDLNKVWKYVSVEKRTDEHGVETQKQCWQNRKTKEFLWVTL